MFVHETGMHADLVALHTLFPQGLETISGSSLVQTIVISIEGNSSSLHWNVTSDPFPVPELGPLSILLFTGRLGAPQLTGRELVNILNSNNCVQSTYLLYSCTVQDQGSTFHHLHTQTSRSYRPE